jgi:hypothetical protein
MAEYDPASDAGTPAPQLPRRSRKPARRKETTPPAGAAPATKSKTDIAIEQAAARLAADAPPLTEWQKRRIAELFAPAVSAVVKR